MSNKYDSTPPPNFPPPAHLDAGPYYPPPTPSPAPGPGAIEYYNPNNRQLQYPPENNNNYGPPAPYNYNQYGPPQPYYGPPQQQGMYYGPQQQGYPPQGYPPQGYFMDRGRGGPSAGEGICAGLLGALACCCCIDFLF